MKFGTVAGGRANVAVSADLPGPPELLELPPDVHPLSATPAITRPAPTAKNFDFNRDGTFFPALESPSDLLNRPRVMSNVPPVRYVRRQSGHAASLARGIPMTLSMVRPTAKSSKKTLQSGNSIGAYLREIHIICTETPLFAGFCTGPPKCVPSAATAESSYLLHREGEMIRRCSTSVRTSEVC
jgi:hypothetical protein